MNDLPVASIKNKLAVPGLDVEPGQRQDTVSIKIAFASFGKNCETLMDLRWLFRSLYLIEYITLCPDYS